MNEQSGYEQSGYDQNRLGEHPGPWYGPQQPAQQQPGYQQQPAAHPYGPEQHRAGGQEFGAAPASTPTATATGGAPPPPRARRRGPVLIVASLALAAVVGAGAGIGSYAYLDSGEQPSPITVTGGSAPQPDDQQDGVENAAGTISPSVVTITVRSGNSGGVGSGVVLDEDGHVLTNAHVVSGLQSSSRSPFGDTSTSSEQITVTLKDGSTSPASVVGVDETDDLAVIKVRDTENLKPATFAESSSVQVGQSVVAVGAPLGLSQTVTSGIVSNTARPVRSGNGDEAVYQAVQTDAAINQGNSGGPLVDLNGAVVGINSAILSESSSSQSGGNIGIGFAIPSDVATRVAGDLIADGQSSDAELGVTVQGSEDQTLGASTTGVPLQSVQNGGPADSAGLRAGDVVTEVDSNPVTTADGLIAAIRYYPPGTPVQIGYTRDGQQHTVKVELGSA